MPEITKHTSTKSYLRTCFNVFSFQAVGIAVSWAVFGCQFLLLYIRADNEDNCKGHSATINISLLGLCKKDVALKFCWIYIGYAILLIAAFFGAVSQFRGYWNLIDVYFISGIYNYYLTISKQAIRAYYT